MFFYKIWIFYVVFGWQVFWSGFFPSFSGSDTIQIFGLCQFDDRMIGLGLITLILNVIDCSTASQLVKVNVGIALLEINTIVSSISTPCLINKFSSLQNMNRAVKSAHCNDIWTGFELFPNMKQINLLHIHHWGCFLASSILCHAHEFVLFCVI